MNRLAPLDWQRGLLAFSIMVYHLVGWKLHAPDASEILGRLGIYGVAMFFTLSGLSMAVVYGGNGSDARSSARFLVRRIFRIWPMLWLAVAVATFGSVALKHEPVDAGLVLLNLTTLFGFVSPGAYINTGAWSIGNEMVYYAMTPALLWVYNRRLAWGNVLLAMTVAAGSYFAFHALSPTQPLASQWGVYINPFNNLLFYCAGIAIHYNLRGVRVAPSAARLALLVSALAFCLYPASGDLIDTVTGVNRIAFFAASALMVAAFYKLDNSLPRLVSAPLAALGVATYGVYLLHPLVYQFVELVKRRLGADWGPSLVIAAVVALTIPLALLVYRWLEEPMIRLDKRLTTPRKRRGDLGPFDRPAMPGRGPAR